MDARVGPLQRTGHWITARLRASAHGALWGVARTVLRQPWLANTVVRTLQRFPSLKLRLRRLMFQGPAVTQRAALNDAQLRVFIDLRDAQPPQRKSR